MHIFNHQNTRIRCSLPSTLFSWDFLNHNALFMQKIHKRYVSAVPYVIELHAVSQSKNYCQAIHYCEITYLALTTFAGALWKI